MENIIFTRGLNIDNPIAVPNGSQIAIWSQSPVKIYQLTSFVNNPPQLSLLATIDGRLVQSYLSAFTAAANIVIDAGAAPVYYEIGTAPVVQNSVNGQVQPTPVALNATGALTAAAILSGIVTSTTGAAVTGTVPIASIFDAAAQFAVGDSWDFTVIATGANAFTIQVAANITNVGSLVVATGTSGRFRIVKTATTPAFVIYRLS